MEDVSEEDISEKDISEKDISKVDINCQMTSRLASASFITSKELILATAHWRQRHLGHRNFGQRPFGQSDVSIKDILTKFVIKGTYPPKTIRTNLL